MKHAKNTHYTCKHTHASKHPNIHTHNICKHTHIHTMHANTHTHTHTGTTVSLLADDVEHV